MSEFTFPEKRFVEADATESEIALLKQQFESGDVTIQRALTDFYEASSTGALREYVERLRGEGHFVDQAAPGDAPEGVSTPVVSTTKKDGLSDSDASDADII